MHIDSPIIFSADVFSQTAQYPAGQVPKELVLAELQVIGERAKAAGMDLAPFCDILLGTFAAFPFTITPEDLASVGISVPYVVS